MARIFQTGFESGKNDEHPGGSVHGTIRSGADTRGAWSDYCMECISRDVGNGVFLEFVDSSEIYLRMGMRIGWSGPDGVFTAGFKVYGSASQPVNNMILDVYPNNSGSLSARSGPNTNSSGGYSLGALTVPFPKQTWVTLEMHFKPHISAGILQIKIDGEMALDFAGNTRPSYWNDAGLANLISYIGLQGDRNAGSSATESIRYDDIAINDTSGPRNNSWVGDGKIKAMRPSAAGDTTTLAIGGSSPPGSNWQAVDEKPPNDGVDYVSSGTPGDRDLYALSDVDVGQVNAIQVVTRSQNDAGGDDLAAVLKQGGTTTVLATKSPTVAWGCQQTIQEINPATGNRWTEAELDALQAGVEIV